MRVPLSHDLGKDEVRRRLQSRSHEIGQYVPGGLADVTTSWPSWGAHARTTCFL